MVAKRIKYQKAIFVFLSFFSRKLRIIKKFDRSSGLLHFGLPSHFSTVALIDQNILQNTAAGTATDFNSIPLHQISNVKISISAIGEIVLF